MDKVSDYEDIWGPESNNCSTFKPLKTENDNNINNGLMKSKKPDLLPDTLREYFNQNVVVRADVKILCTHFNNLLIYSKNEQRKEYSVNFGKRKYTHHELNREFKWKEKSFW